MDFLKTWKSFVMLVCFMLMLCIWPFCLVRKEVVQTSVLTAKYAGTEQRITKNAPLQQTFIAQTSRLEKILILLERDSDVEIVPNEGALRFELLNSEGETIFDGKIDFSEMNWGEFHTIPIHRWIRAGQEYTYRISVEEKYDGIFYGIYTTEVQQHAMGSLVFYIGDVLIDGQSFAGYGYGYPLNIKNVLCLWGGNSGNWLQSLRYNRRFQRRKFQKQKNIYAD